MRSTTSLGVNPRRKTFFTAQYSPQIIPELVLLPLVSVLNMLGKLQWGLLVLLAVSAFARAHRRPAARDFTYLPALVFFALILLTYRSFDLYYLTLKFVLILAVLFAISGMATVRSAFDSLLAGMTVYLAVNIVAWIAGFKVKDPGRTLGATSSPFFKERIVFPFATSVNEPPYVAAAVIAGVVALISLRCRPHRYLWIGVGLSLFALLASNNRTAMVVVVVFSAALLLAPEFTRRAAPFVVGGALLLPFYVGAFKPLLGAIATLLQGNSYMARGGRVDDIATFEGRQMIWSSYIRFWTEHTPGLDSILLGYGRAGHVKSGAYLYVPKSASNFLRDRTSLHSHNSMLQSTFETGLIGAAALFAVIVLVVYRYGRVRSMLPAFAATTALASAGMWEPLVIPGAGVVPVLILYVVFFTPIARHRAGADDPIPPESITTAPPKPVADRHPRYAW